MPASIAVYTFIVDIANRDQPDDFSLSVGDQPANPLDPAISNPLCKSFAQLGIYECISPPMTGQYIVFTRGPTSTSSEKLMVCELLVYSNVNVAGKFG